MGKKHNGTPAHQAMNPGKGGIVPPVEHRFEPGESGNPKGRPAAGAAVREWINALAAQDVSEEELRTLSKDPKCTWSKRTAANRMLRTLERGDIADFAGLLRGENNLEDLRAMGINTEVVKKLKQKTRIVPIGDGATEEVIEREVELFDRAGVDFDRVCDRTVGKPNQTIQTEDVTQRREPTDEDWVAFYEAHHVALADWAPHLRAKFESGRIRVVSREVKELPQ